MNRILYSADCLDFLKHSLPKLMRHWIAAAPLFLIVAAAAFPFMDRFPPTVDEFNSLLNAGWLGSDINTAQDVIQSLQHRSPDHTPAYFIILRFWGNFVAQDIAMARLISVFAALLALAFIWRLAFDFISPGVGIVAAMLLASNAFFNWYVIHARMYPLVVLLACVALWLYLRIQFRLTRPKITDYLALACAVFFYCNLHFFNLLYLAALAGFHIVFAPKNRRWLFTAAAVLLAVTLFSPYAITAIDPLLAAAATRNDDPALQLDAIGGLWYWFKIATNAQPLLLIIPLAGFAHSVCHRDRRRLLWLAICGSCLLALAATAQFSTDIVYRAMRYHLAVLPITICCLAAGAFAWRRHALWLLIFALICCAMGLKWQRSADWRDLLGNRYRVVDAPPSQVISRIARQAQPSPGYIIYFADWAYGQMLNYGKTRPLWRPFEQTQEEYFFKQHGIEIIDLQETADDAFLSVDRASPIWLIYRTPQITEAAQSRIDVLMDRLAYKRCDTLHIANDTVIDEYFSDDTTCD